MMYSIQYIPYAAYRETMRASAALGIDKTRCHIGCCLSQREAPRMDQEQTTRIHELCQQIAEEQDQEKFLVLVRELNQLLEEKGKRLKNAVPHQVK